MLGVCIKNVSCRVANVAMREDEIISIKIGGDDTFEIHDYKEVMEAVELIGDGRKHLIYIKVDPQIMPTVETRNFMASSESTSFTKARAFHISSLAQRIIGNFIINIQRPTVPMRLFTDEDEAVEWLKSMN